MNLVEQIVKHPAVSRVYANGCKIELLTDNLSLQALCRLRRMRGNAKRAIHNAREDVEATGYTTSVAKMPRTSLERKCLLTAYGRRTLDLPNDLADLVQAAVEGRSTTLRLSDRETATILHGLRLIQERSRDVRGILAISTGTAECYSAMCHHFDEAEPLSDVEIDALCERLNA